MFRRVRRLSLTLCLLAIGWAARTPAEDVSRQEQRILSRSMAGFARLTPAEASGLERKIESDPEDRLSRIQLIAFYAFEPRPASDVKRARHVRWFIEHHPESAVLSHNHLAGFTGAEHAPTLDLWKKQVEAHSQNATVLANAAVFHLISDRPHSIALLKQASTLEPENLNWSDRLGHAHLLDAVESSRNRSPEEQKQSAILAQREFRKVYQGRDDRGKAVALGYLLKVAIAAEDLDAASRDANDALARAEKGREGVDLIHIGNTVLGRVALRKGDLSEARSRLLASGQISTPSPVLESFGPEMSLSNELLEKGESETVLKYLDLCEVFWKSGGRVLKRWREAIEAGKKPDLLRKE